MTFLGIKTKHSYFMLLPGKAGSGYNGNCGFDLSWVIIGDMPREYSHDLYIFEISMKHPIPTFAARKVFGIHKL